MQNKDKGDGIEDSTLDMLIVILHEGASKEVVMPSTVYERYLDTYFTRSNFMLIFEVVFLV